MKRILSFIVAVMFATQAWAAATTFTVGKLKYTVTDETNHYVSVGKGSTEPTGALNIQEKVTNPNDGLEYTVTSIGFRAFRNCSSLTAVSLPNSITNISEQTFSYCSGLTTITIPNSVTSIGSFAFSHCSKLTSVTIPNSVESIGDAVFEGCSGLTEISVERSNTKYASQDGVLFNKDKTTIVCYPAHKTGTTYTIPQTVKSIEDYAFYGCGRLTTVNIPQTVKSIGDKAFYGCIGLTSVTIPDFVTSIGWCTFYGCSSLTSVTIPKSVIIIGSVAFEGCSSLTTVTIPNSVTSIGSAAFSNCSGLTSVTIGNSVTDIWEEAFSGCTSLTSINIPNSVTSIKSGAFYGCKGLKEINVGSANTNYTSENGVLYNIGKTNLICYPSAKAEAAYTIPDGVTSIDNCAFECCSSLRSVTIPNSVTNIDDYAFIDCRGLKEINVGSENTKYASQDGVLFNKDKTTIILYPATKAEESYIIPNSVTTIGGEAFYECRNLKYITIGNSVTSIGARAFYNCRGLTWIVYDGTHQPTCGTDAFDRVNPSVPVCVPEEYEGDSWCGLRLHDIVSLFPTVTCTEAGFIGGSCCLKCERILVAPQEVDALGHDWSTPTYKWAEDGHACSATAVCKRNEDHIATEEVTATSEETVAATCEEMGTTTYTATFENEPFTTQTKTVVDIPATGHTADSVEFENIVPATCTAAGSKDSVVFCSVCQAELSREEKEIAPLGHTPNSVEFENIVPATCTTVGTYDSVVYCSVCQVELFREEKEVAALGHTYNSAITAPTCTAVGYTTHTCSVCEYTYNSDTIAASGHTEVVDAAIAATCTAAGKTEGKHCSVCDAVLVAQEEVAALGHKFEKYTYNNDATTAADGTETSTCERGCGATDTRVAEGTKLPETEKGTAVSEVASTLNIYAHGNTIVVENATDEISIYNARGTLVCRNATPCVRTEILITAPGIYIVKVGGTAKRVMVE